MINYSVDNFALLVVGLVCIIYSIYILLRHPTIKISDKIEIKTHLSNVFIINFNELEKVEFIWRYGYLRARGFTKIKFYLKNRKIISYGPLFLIKVSVLEKILRKIGIKVDIKETRMNKILYPYKRW